MASVSELIAQSRNKQISSTALMRGLVSHKEWQILLSEAAVEETLTTNSTPPLQLLTTKEGKSSLLLFSTLGTLNAYREARDASVVQHSLQVPGTWVFQLPLEKIDLLWVDPLTPYDVSYGKGFYDSLRDLAKAILVEEALVALRQATASQDAIRTLREFKNYYLPIMTRNETRSLVMAPDPKGRALAAAFTANDTFDAFLPEAQQMAEGGEVQQMQVSGASLFDTLRRMQVDGIVFNCSGPVPPVAFAQGIAEIILQG